MIAITGITGRIGGDLANHLLARGVGVRGVVRNPEKGEEWRKKGCQVVVAQPTDVSALTTAFKGAEAVFVLPPPVFDPQPGFAEAYTAMTAHRDAVRAANVARVLYLSTVGAQARQTNLLSQHTIGEGIFGELSVPVTFLRPAWFLENASWDIASAREAGVMHSFLRPLDRALPMVSARDISQLATDVILEKWEGKRVVELEGPARVSPQVLARALAKALGRTVDVQAVPRESWEGLFVRQGMINPYPRIRMLDGFNEGWIDFEGEENEIRKGKTTADRVIQELVEKP
jgi:NAD(P)H dehydrogenase (quinone)